MKSTKMGRHFLLASLFVAGLAKVSPGWSVGSDQPQVGKKAADSYFLKRKRVQSRQTKRRVSSAGAPRYLALHFGAFVEDESFRWGRDKSGKDNGNLTIGVSYRLGEWTNSMDLLFRADFLSYEVNNERPYKLSLLPMVTFPDANSQFPLYFGAGIGAGFFFRQVGDESAVSLDYQLVAGGRFFDVVDTMGLLFEVGLKNHIHLLSDGQYNGLFAALGTVFAF